ncbi:MAG: hypothetical protein HUU20_18860, partial [Pirellulales bacterium]|nr:hypothetical protein [Pirellulales bacterium]
MDMSTTIVLLASLLGPIAASHVAASPPEERPMLRVPVTGAAPAIDGNLEEPCWQNAARTGPLKDAHGQPGKPATEAFILRDADQLYVALRGAGASNMAGDPPAGTPPKGTDFAELWINSNGDRNSSYRIRISPEGGGQVFCSYHEYSPPWHDRSWQPKLKAAAVKGPEAWTAEIALPWVVFCKNKTLASEIGFNVRRTGVPGQETQGWHSASANPGDWGILTGIPARESLPAPAYSKPKPDPSSSGAQWGVDTYRVPEPARRAFLAEQREQTIELGPGSTHPGATGEVRLELEGFLLAGDPHARGIIWDLAVNEQQGELYVLADPRRVREAPELRVFDRQGRYLRTIMPLNPTLPRAHVQDLCRMMAREGGTDLVVPKLFETLCGSLSLYGAWWHLPQKMTLAPNGELILSNVYRGTLWRMRPDGSLPLEGWTSVYHRGRNEPFESHDWTQDFLNVQDLQNYLPFHSLHYPYFGFDRSGMLYISAGQSSRPTKNFAYHWEVGQESVTYHREVPAAEGRGAYVWKCRIHEGVRFEEQGFFGGFAEPSGLVHDGRHLIVADSGNNRLQVLGEDGRVAASITHYEHEGKKVPLDCPTALAIDREQNLYVLLASRPRTPDQPIVVDTAGAGFYHLEVTAGSATFQVNVKGGAWAVAPPVGSEDRGLHLLSKATPLYFEVPASTTAFDLSLIAEPPGETAVATLFDPANREVARFDVSAKSVDLQTIKVTSPGWWKVVVDKAPAGVLDDV